MTKYTKTFAEAMQEVRSTKESNYKFDGKVVSISKANFSKGYKDLFFPSGKGTVTFQELGEVPNSKVLDVKLSDFFNHKDLYNRYPDLKNLKVRFYSNPDSRILGTAYADGSISVNISDFKNYEIIDQDGAKVLIYMKFSMLFKIMKVLYQGEVDKV